MNRSWGNETQVPDLGLLLLQAGTITRSQLQECLREQSEAARAEAASVPRIGEILVRKGYARYSDIVAALGQQARKPLFCSRCRVTVTVRLRPDASSYKCGQCETTLTEVPTGTPPTISEAMPADPRRRASPTPRPTLGRASCGDAAGR
ncbi:MAG: hypothetical protein HY716_00260 [Planctomycetes bacterium]|nr:hypothetical protein [Planctomycetota bacterium]